MGQAATQLLCVALPRLVTAALLYENNDPAQITAFAQTAEDADALRVQLAAAGLVAFVADGSILPRRSGVDERPLPGKAVVRWQSPPERQVSFTLPNAGEISGMGVPAGVTLIVGGGFHGKSTLLNALQHGVYNHRPHDGRERVVTVESAVKIRAEDGRFVCGVDISPFINNLPFGRQTEAFHSENASGSTSQAANIMEALAIGTELLLIDEDTAATNFMIRDRRMQALIAKEQEPITPFIDRVRQLYDEHGISTILVMGGSGDYFDVADQVISMSAYRAYERTAAAKAISAQFDTARTVETSGPFGALRPRLPQPGSLNARKGKRARYMKVHDRHTIQFGTERIDLSQVAQLVDRGQTRAIAGALLYARERYMDGKRPLREICRLVMADIEREGLGVLNGRPGNDYAQFRPYELAAALNRLRSLRVNNP